MHWRWSTYNLHFYLPYPQNNILFIFVRKTILDNKMDILNALAVVYMAGSTNTAAAVNDLNREIYHHQDGDRADVKDVAIIITDGK